MKQFQPPAQVMEPEKVLNRCRRRRTRRHDGETKTHTSGQAFTLWTRAGPELDHGAINYQWLWPRTHVGTHFKRAARLLAAHLAWSAAGWDPAAPSGSTSGWQRLGSD
uniref:Uncharacterized protein n=1 Tax=Knipowitschia caucasica TaxID=637954 RepID=A0AAV2MHI9_KNICA